MPQFPDPKYIVRGGYNVEETNPRVDYQERMRRQAIASRQVSGADPEQAYDKYVKGAAAQTARDTAARANRRYGSKPVSPST